MQLGTNRLAARCSAKYFVLKRARARATQKGEKASPGERWAAFLLAKGSSEAAAEEVQEEQQPALPAATAPAVDSV